jgi:hypothetical protein
MNNWKENRRLPRFEPPFVDVNLNFPNKQTIGFVLDSSCGGLSIALPDDVVLPPVRTPLSIDLIDHSSRMPIGNATVIRTWSGKGLFDDVKGVAVQFDQDLADDEIKSILLRGNQQKIRLEAQAELAKVDMDYLIGYRHDLTESQLKLFTLALTIGVALASAYFGLIYHGSATGVLARPDLSFWRTMVASLPGFLAVACTLLVVHKSISIQQIDAYISVLKDCVLLQQYPREYKGWEFEIRRLRHILGTKICEKCRYIKPRPCGDLKDEERKSLNSKPLLHNPPIDTNHLVTFSAFFVICSLSIVAVLIELISYQRGIMFYMVVASIITLLLCGALAYSVYVFIHLRKGRYSVTHFRRCWVDLLTRCRHQA